MCPIFGQRGKENEKKKKKVSDVPELLLFIKNLSADDEEPTCF